MVNEVLSAMRQRPSSGRSRFFENNRIVPGWLVNDEPAAQKVDSRCSIRSRLEGIEENACNGRRIVAIVDVEVDNDPAHYVTGLLRRIPIWVKKRAESSLPAGHNNKTTRGIKREIFEHRDLLHRRLAA